jgi:hypothetical protein
MPSSEVMHKFKTGKLKSGGSGKPVTNRSQAIAIMLSEKRNEAEHGGEYVSGTESRNPLAGTRRRRGK